MPNLAELLEQHGATGRRVGEHHHARAGWVQYDCPHCSPGSGAFRMGLRVAFGYFNCWLCGRVDTARTIALLTRCDLRTAIELSRSATRTSPVDVVLPGSGTYRPPTNQKRLREHAEYIRSRNIDPATAARVWNVSGTGHDSDCPWRIVLPIFRNDVAVSWTARSIGTSSLRYLSAPPDRESFPHRNWLYGLDFARGSVIVTEGPLDAMRIGPGAVATMGTSWNVAQLALIRRYPRRVVCFDNETDAQKRAVALCHELGVFPGTTTNLVLDAKDAADASQHEIDLVRKHYLD